MGVPHYPCNSASVPYTYKVSVSPLCVSRGVIQEIQIEKVTHFRGDFQITNNFWGD